MAKNTIEIIVEAVDDATRILDQVEKDIKEIKHLVHDTPDFDVNVRMAKEKIEQIKDELRSLPEREEIVIDIDTSGAIPALMAVGPAVVPALASVVAVAGGLAPAFAAAGAGAAAFGAIAIPSLTKIFEAEEQIQKVNEKLADADTAKERAQALKELEQVYSGLTGKQREALKALQSFKSFWDGFVKSLQDPVLDVFINGLRSLQGVLTTLKPMFQSSIQAIADVFNKLNQTMKGAEFQRFFQWLNANAGPSIRAFGDAFINVLRGVINIIMAFTPLADDMQGGLVRLTQRFAEWSAGLANSQGFKQFVSYVQQNGPKLMDVLGQVGELLINLTKAMAPLGPVVLDVVSGLLSMINYLLELHPAVGVVLVSILQLIGTIRLISTAATGFTILKNNVLQVGSILKTVGGWVKTGAVGAFNLLKTGLTGLVNIFRIVGTGIMTFGRIAGTWLLQARRFFLTFGQMAVTAIRTVGMAMLTNPIGLAITLIIGAIILLIMYWDQVKVFLLATWEAIKAAAIAVWGWLTQFLSTLWNGIKSVAIAVWNAIKSGLLAIWNGIKSAASSAFNGAKSVITSVWNAIKSVSVSVWNGIKSAVLAVWNALKSSASSVFNAAKSIITSVWNAIKSTTSSVWNGIKSLISSVWNGIKSFVSSAVNGIKSTVTSVWNGIKSITSSVWNSVKSVISSGLRSAWSFIKGFAGNFLSAGKGLLDALVRGIKSGISKAISAVKSGMQAIRNFLPFSPAKEGPLSDLDKSGESFFPTFASKMNAQSAIDAVKMGMAQLRNQIDDDTGMVTGSIAGGFTSQLAGAPPVTVNFYGPVTINGEPTIATRELGRMISEEIARRLKKAQRGRGIQ